MIPENTSFSYPINSLEHLLQGTVLLIDKPISWTSFDVVNKIKWEVRRSLKLKKFKIGHAGTLDPLASGLLVICTGKLTKSIIDIQSGMKEYTGTIFIGKTTPSYDLETIPEGEFQTEHITETLIRQNAEAMIGVQQQLPPVFSAKWVDGVRAYVSARQGIAVDMPPQNIEVTEFEITRIALPEIDFRIKCSKGTYIRTIAHDFGKNLNSGSYLKSLRRTESIPFRIEEAMEWDKLLPELARLSPETVLQPSDKQ